MPTAHVKAKAPPWPSPFHAPRVVRLIAEKGVHRTFVAQVAALEVDESLAKVQLISPDMTCREVIEILSDFKQRILNRMSPGVHSIRLKTGRQFKIDCGDLIMPKGSWFVVVTVTRTA